MFEPVTTKVSLDEVKKLTVKRFSVIPCEGDERVSIEYILEDSFPERGVTDTFKWQQDFMVSSLPSEFASVRAAIFQLCAQQCVDPRIAEKAILLEAKLKEERIAEQERLTMEAKDASDADSLS